MKALTNFFNQIFIKAQTKEKSKLDNTFIIIGCIWLVCGFLRSTPLVNYNLPLFILGIAPNFFAPFLFFVFFKNLIFKNVKLSQDNIIKILLLIFTLGFISEIIHHFFLNSPFDIFDMVATLLASVIIFLIYRKNS